MRDGARDFVLGAEDVVGDFSALDWVLLAGVLAALLWAWLRLRATSRLGPVEVDLLVHDGENTAKADVQALTAILRERLANSGVSPPPAVPAGAPQTDLIAAIEASDVPQAKWIGKLLEIVPWPQPLAFKLSGTLYGPVGEQTNAERGIRIWLRPTAHGRELLETISGAKFDDVVRAAADRIFMHISTEAVSVFPAWAHWRNRDALHCYVEGVQARTERKEWAARIWLRRAAIAEPRNVLPRLQLANLYERELPKIVLGTKKPQDVRRHASVLRRYLDLAVERPDLVEPRYRASVVAGLLATACEGTIRAPQTVADRVGLPATDLAAALRDLSARESEAALQLLRAWYVPLRLSRMRNRYEPRGYERQLLHRGLAISGHCLGVRSRLRSNTRPATLDLWRRRAVVWGFHLQVGRATTGWHAHYNAACFYALLDQRQDSLAPASPRRRAIRRAAYRHLNRAIEEDIELSSDWIENSDPDLASLRTSGDREWTVFKARLRGEAPPDGEQPERPWGSPTLRQRWWTGALAISLFATAAAVVAMTVIGDLWLLVLIAAATTTGLASWRRSSAVREVEVKRHEPAGSSPAAPPSRARSHAPRPRS